MDFKAEYFNIWSVAWQLHKEFYSMESTDEGWERLINKSGEIMKQWEDKPQAEFVKKLLLAVIDEIERRDKERRSK